MTAKANRRTTDRRWRKYKRRNRDWQLMLSIPSEHVFILLVTL